MGALIAFRAVQGVGAGAIQPMSMTIVGDIYTLAERAKVQGYVAGVWAVASVVGPTLGGLFADYASWRWIFFINLPLGLVAGLMVWRHLHEQVERRRHRIDVAGSLLLTAGGVLLLLALLEGGVRWAWSSPPSVVLFALAGLLLVAFVLVERRAAEPVLPLWLMRHRVLVSAMTASLVVGVLMMGLTSYVPLYAQGVLGYGAVAAGFALAAMTLGWPIAASNAGRLYLTVGFRTTMLIGGVVGVVGAALLLPIGPHSSLLLLAVPCFVLGIGFGLVVSPSVIAAQSSVTWQDRGVATGATLFARSVGSALGVAVFGAIVNHQVAVRLGRGVPDVSSLTPAILDPAIHQVFVASAVVAVSLLAVGALMPRRIQEPTEELGSGSPVEPAGRSQEA